MKKISTLGFGILFSLASFANAVPRRSAETNANIKVTVDGNRFDRHPAVNTQVNDRRKDNRGHNSDNSYADDRGRHNDDYGKRNGYDNNSNYYSRSISNEDFFAAERVMDRENDNGRLLYAKRIMDDNYLTAEQVKELARFFSFDDNRIDFARYAYGKTIDKNNFNVVCNSFSSNDGRNQVMSFIKSCR